MFFLNQLQNRLLHKCLLKILQSFLKVSLSIQLSANVKSVKIISVRILAAIYDVSTGNYLKVKTCRTCSKRHLQTAIGTVDIITMFTRSLRGRTTRAGLATHFKRCEKRQREEYLCFCDTRSNAGVSLGNKMVAMLPVTMCGP